MDRSKTASGVISGIPHPHIRPLHPHIRPLPPTHREQAGLSVEDTGTLWDPENFTFTYTVNTDKYELYDEQQILYPYKFTSTALIHFM